MSALIYTPVDHIAPMDAALITQFKGLPVIEACIAAIGAQFNDIDEFFGQLMTLLPLQNAFGEQLDALGGTLNQSRNGLGDSDYKTLLQARIVAYRSNGTVESLIQILLTLGAAQNVQAIERQPAAISIVVAGEGTPALTNNDIVTSVYQAKLAGVLLTLNAATELPIFQFDAPNSANSAGFDQGHIAGPYT